MDSNSTPSYYKTNLLLHKSILAIYQILFPPPYERQMEKASGNATQACCKCSSFVPRPHTQGSARSGDETTSAVYDIKLHSINDLFNWLSLDLTIASPKCVTLHSF